EISYFGSTGLLILVRSPFSSRILANFANSIAISPKKGVSKFRSWCEVPENPSSRFPPRRALVAPDLELRPPCSRLARYQSSWPLMLRCLVPSPPERPIHHR